MADTPRSMKMTVTPEIAPMEFLEAERYPGRVMRALLAVREVALIVLLAVTAILVVMLMSGLGTILNAISRAA